MHGYQSLIKSSWEVLEQCLVANIVRKDVLLFNSPILFGWQHSYQTRWSKYFVLVNNIMCRFAIKALAYYAQIFTYHALKIAQKVTQYANIIPNMPTKLIILKEKTALLEFIHI